MDDKDFSWLAAKQKRLITWRQFSKEEIQDPAIRGQTELTLSEFGDLLNKIWESRTLTDADKFKIDNFERKLEQLNEEARIRVVAKG